MKVLSLFDGISCGRVALERAGIPVECYYASEIDKYAITVAQKNFPDTIQLGDINNWQNWDIDWSSIALVIGGSPCQGFSFAGKQLNFGDPRSKLFFVYADILDFIKKKNPSIKFLLENVKMKQIFQDIITDHLGVKPVEINSALVSAQNRKRLYWANWDFGQPEDKGILLKDILESGYTERQKSKCLRCGGLGSPYNSKQQWSMPNSQREYTPVECERLQTLPDNYTEGVSNSQRYKMLGNGWTVDVITHLFSYLLEV